MNTTRKLHGFARAGVIVIALSASLTACTTRPAAIDTPAPTPASTYEPIWRAAPHWSQLRLCADDRVHTGASDSFEAAWRECVVLMSLAEPPASLR